jgi:hypothetical protein
MQWELHGQTGKRRMRASFSRNIVIDSIRRERTKFQTTAGRLSLVFQEALGISKKFVLFHL